MKQSLREAVAQIFFFAGLLALTSIAAAHANKGLAVQVNHIQPLMMEAQSNPLSLP